MWAYGKSIKSSIYDFMGTSHSIGGVQADGTAIAATELQPLHNFFTEVSFNTFDHKKMPCGVSKLI